MEPARHSAQTRELKQQPGVAVAIGSRRLSLRWAEWHSCQWPAPMGSSRGQCYLLLAGAARSARPTRAQELNILNILIILDTISRPPLQKRPSICKLSLSPTLDQLAIGNHALGRSARRRPSRAVGGDAREATSAKWRLGAGRISTASSDG